MSNPWVPTMFVAMRASLCGLVIVLFQACTVDASNPSIPDAAVADAPGDAAVDAHAPDASLRCDTEGATLGESCAVDADCDDVCFCDGIERCESGVCVAGVPPCADAVGEGEPECMAPLCLESARACTTTPDDSRCDDGEPCNGAETCSATRGCLETAAPACDDADTCTIDSCELGVGCAHAPRDLDADGHPDVRCGGDDCDDDPRSGSETHPGGGEDCENGQDDDCDGAVDFEDTDCTPTNDDCATATPLSSEGHLFGTTRGLDADAILSCADAGPDAFYLLHLDAAQDVSLSARAGSSTVSLALRSLSTCADGPDLRCTSRVGPSFLARSLAAGDYAVIVRTPIAGPFTLDLALGAPTTPPLHETCAPVTETLVSGVTSTGRFDEVVDDLRPACRDDGGAVQEVVYRLDVAEPSDVLVTASVGGGVSGDAAYLALVTTCSSTSSSLVCSLDRSPVLRRRALAAGTYFVVLEPEDGSALTYALTAEVTPAAAPAQGDACASAIDVPASGHVSIPVAALTQDGGTSCGGGSAVERDAVLRLTLATAADVMIAATTSGGIGESISIRTDCEREPTDLACRSGPLTVRALAAGTYTVVVTTGATSGDLVVDVTTTSASAPVPGDHCERMVDASAGVRVTGSFAGASDDLRGGACSGAGRPDAYYGLSLAAESRVLALVESGVPGIVALTLREGACAGPELACQSGTTAAFERVLPAGEYVLVVEGDQPVSGAYRLRVDVEAP